MVIGIDKGSTYTKSSKGIILKSTVRPYYDNEVNLNNEMNIVEIFREKFVVGGIGNYSTDLMKAQHEDTRILTYTAIAKSLDEEYIKTSVILGLPIGLYSKQKSKMKELFKLKELVDIKINGKKKYIVIDNLEVFPEAAGAFYNQEDEKDGLIIDIGGLSVDTALFKDKKLIKYSTYSMGIMKLYSKIANDINSEFDLSLMEWDIEDILKDGLYIYGKKEPVRSEELISAHVKAIIERLKLEYDLKAINNIFVTGGGGIMCYNYLKPYMPQSRLMDKSQTSNVYGFEKIGQALFKQ